MDEADECNWGGRFVIDCGEGPRTAVAGKERVDENLVRRL